MSIDDLTPEQRAHLDLWHSGGADDCATDVTSPCFIKRLLDECDTLREQLVQALAGPPPTDEGGED